MLNYCRSQNASYQEIPELINGTSSLARIAYGKSVPKGVMPFAVFLEIEAADGVYNCGGTLIGKETVLTAAHCFFDEFGYLAAYSAVAVVGERVIKRSNKLYEVTDVVKPSGFNPAFSYELFGDIAIIKLGSRPNRKPMKLGSKKTSVPKWYITAGWGLTEDNRRASEVLQYAAVPSLSIRQVQAWTQNIGAYYSMEVDHIAAGLGSDRADSCQGDSGGPLFKPGKQYSNSESSTDILMGVVSYGLSSRCGLKNRNVGFYTSVPYWRSWILSQMKKRGWK